MKIIVVDDNKIVRDEVCEILKKISFVTVENTFSNGEEAFEWIKGNETDVVISDVQMPKMNGIELIEAINREKPQVKVIFLSCYDDFSYIRDALRNRAFDYVLKPMNEEDCINVINKVYEEYKKEKKKETDNKIFINQSCEQFLYKLLTSTRLPKNYEKNFENYGINKDDCEFAVIDVKHLCDYEEFQVLLSIIKEDFKTFYDKIMSYYFIEMSSTELVILCFGDVETDELVDNIIELQNKISQNITERLSFGISNSKNDISEMQNAYKEAKKALGYTVYSSSYKVIQYETIEKIKNGEISVSAVQKELSKLIELENKEAIFPFIDKYLAEDTYFSEAYAKSFTYSVVFSLENILNEQGYSLENIDGSSIWDKIENFGTILNIRSWVYNIIKSTLDVLFGNQHTTKTELVNAIKKIVRHSYGEKLTVKEISGRLHYSTKHLSVVFNEIEKCSISSYITKFRMEKAKELLMNNDMRIYNVVEMVGYKKTEIFNKTFKAYTGYSPSEYKKMVTPKGKEKENEEEA